MNLKNNNKNNNSSESNDNIIAKINEKNNIFQEIIRNTFHSINIYKNLELFSNGDISNCIENLNTLYIKTKLISNNLYDSKQSIDDLQNIINLLTIFISNYGTYYLEDLLYIIFGSENKNIHFKNDIIKDKYKILLKYFHPTGFKIINKKNEYNTNNILCSNKKSENSIVYENENSLECFDINSLSFNFMVNGIQVLIHKTQTKYYLIQGILDNAMIELLNNNYIDKRIENINMLSESNETINKIIFKRYIECSTLKDFLVNGDEDFIKNYYNIIKTVDDFYKNNTYSNINEFLKLDLFSQRKLLISLMIYNKNDEIKYITYLLYDILSVKTTNNKFIEDIDSSEQKKIYNSFPCNIQKYFKESMKYTISYTQDMMCKYDNNKLSLEHQIYLLKTTEYVKEKAINKLKEIKGRNDDISIKSKQYLEGLLKIPFNNYKEEPVLKMIKEINKNFIEIANVYFNSYNKIYDDNNTEIHWYKKDKYTNNEIMFYNNKMLTKIKNDFISKLDSNIENYSKKKMKDIKKYFKNFLNIHIDENNFKNEIINHYDNILDNNTNNSIIDDINNLFYNKNDNQNQFINIYKNCNKNVNDIKYIDNSLKNILKTLDDSIYGHNNAKNQIFKIISQWVNGEQSGYCFGFEGSPGIGKTSLAKKGLSKCLIDDNNNNRPFAFIAIGGSSNGSTLEGHSYTYVNSTWGRIVDILMETKCMNPIIYIDELDKVSKTEHGKEIIGILTHLIDYTQNNSFQDKYFSGIDLDVSKALFIFSYNDPDQIDPILLDRIHRIKFDNLSTDDKIVIVKNYILPNINEKMGFSNTVVLNDDIIEYIIEIYTLEPGVRKLKEIIFDLYGEINIELLKIDTKIIQLPIIVTKHDIENKYLKNYIKINEKKIHKDNKIGVINGLWANSLGKGGIVTIESIFFPSSTFLDFKLTGQQGDVMKESMNVAKNLAWSLTETHIKTKLIENFQKTLCQGIHVNCQEGSISKDGPSAGAAAV